ncbi:helix-turn-helix domain-containing protein [Bacillus pacificus]
MELGRSEINEWYTQKQVAERLGVSKATVYHYAKQNKIRKMADPHRLHREARYYKEEVDRLASERGAISNRYATFRSGQTVGFICSKCL